MLSEDNKYKTKATTTTQEKQDTLWNINSVDFTLKYTWITTYKMEVVYTKRFWSFCFMDKLFNNFINFIWKSPIRIYNQPILMLELFTKKKSKIIYLGITTSLVTSDFQLSTTYTNSGRSKNAITHEPILEVLPLMSPIFTYIFHPFVSFTKTMKLSY